jgi:hypothetical protein
MSALQELIREQAQRLSQPDVKKQRDHWLQQEEQLLAQLEAWLKAADPDGALKVEKTSHELREEKFGSYAASGMRIDLGGRRVEIVPRGGAVGGVVPLEDGRPVRIHGLVDVSNDVERYRLYRTLDDSGERWFIKHRAAERAVSLDRTNFESAMVDLLK